MRMLLAITPTWPFQVLAIPAREWIAQPCCARNPMTAPSTHLPENGDVLPLLRAAAIRIFS